MKREIARSVKRFPLSLALLFIAALIPLSGGAAEIIMPSIFGDNMVLQRGMEIPVWGKAEADEPITVAIDTLTVHTTAGGDGTWSVRLPAMEAGGPYEMLVAGNDSVVFSNVMIGEVWVCSGQSNMQWPMKQLDNVNDDIESADYPDMRLFTVDKVSKTEPQFDFPGKKPEWLPCTPETVRDFSAVAYYFGRKLHGELKVPIGLVHASWGGSVAEAWTRLETLMSRPELKPIVEDIDSLAAHHMEEKARYEKKLAAWRKAREENLPPPPYPRAPRGPGERDYPSGLFNAMIAPMIPYGIAGVIWYQGESNAVRAYQYRTLFPAMIRDWRRAWGQGDFPFLFVQLANWETETIPAEDGWGSWPELREAQLMTLAGVPNTGMAVTIDIGDPENIHPKNKRDVGHRLALNALALAYGRRVAGSGPIYTSMFRDGRMIRIRFRHVDRGLIAGSMQPLTGFEIAGEDRVFHEAEARIEGNEVCVFSDEVPEPVAVRYGWDDNPQCNLYNTAGLPASPFRTDDWPGVTEGRLKP